MREKIISSVSEKVCKVGTTKDKGVASLFAVVFLCSFASKAKFTITWFGVLAFSFKAANCQIRGAQQNFFPAPYLSSALTTSSFFSPVGVSKRWEISTTYTVLLSHPY
jgi:hypothetical protein